MLDRLKLIIKNNLLNKENKQLHEKNKTNRLYVENLELQKFHCRNVANKTLEALESLQEIDRTSIVEEEKIKHRNIIINYLRRQNIDIIKELEQSSKHI